MIKVFFSKALTWIGYTEIFRFCSDDELRTMKEEIRKIGFDVKFYRQSVQVYNFFEGRYIERNITYIVWDSEKYFDKLKENNEDIVDADI